MIFVLIEPFAPKQLFWLDNSIYWCAHPWSNCGSKRVDCNFFDRIRPIIIYSGRQKSHEVKFTQTSELKFQVNFTKGELGVVVDDVIHCLYVPFRTGDSIEQFLGLLVDYDSQLRPSPVISQVKKCSHLSSCSLLGTAQIKNWFMWENKEFDPLLNVGNFYGPYHS